MSWISDLFAYVSAYDPSFRLRAKGASDGEIQEIEHEMGSPVPQVHREYLQSLGRDDGGLFAAARAGTDVGSVLRLISIIKDENPTADLKTFKPIADGDVSEGWALVSQGNEWQVVQIDHNGPGEYVAQSLPQLAFYTAFGLRMKTPAHRVRFTIRDSKLTLASVEKEAAALGFSPEWFSDQVSFFGVGQGTLVQIHSRAGIGFDGSIAGSELERTTQLASALAKRFRGTLT